MPAVTLNAPEKAREFFAGKLDFTVSPAELNEQIEKGGKNFIIDVRETIYFIKGHISGAINLPRSNWGKISGWRNDRPLIIYGHSQICHLAAHAALEFAQQGYSVIELEGGFAAWKESKLPVEI